MGANSNLKAVGEKAAYGAAREIVRDRVEHTRDRFEAGADNLTEHAADRVEALAERVRELGARHDRRDEAQTVARRLERTADYLRYRPVAKVPGDAWQAAKNSPTAWATAAVAAGLVTYVAVRRSRRRTT